MPNVAPGNRASTACASTWAVEWRIVNSPRASDAVTMATSLPSSSGHTRSRSTPSTTAITAALRRPRPIAAASSPAVVPCSTSRLEPSGSLIVSGLVMATEGSEGPQELRSNSRPVEHVGRRASRLFLGHVDHALRAAVGRGDVGSLRRQALRLLRGVRVHVLLAREVADLEHHLVDELSEDHPVITTVAVPVDGDRLAEP